MKARRKHGTISDEESRSLTAEGKHAFARDDRVLKHRHGGAGRADLFVMMVIYNPVRYRSRWKLYQDAAKRVKEQHGILCVAEIAVGHRKFVIGQGEDPVKPDFLLQLQTDSEYWTKEIGQNLLTAYVSSEVIDAQYFAYVDADVSFVRDDIFNETVQQLQTFDVVQMWSFAQDLGPNNEPLDQHHSFVYSWRHQEPPAPEPGDYEAPPKPTGKVHLWHPGYAWAWRREAISKVGRLIDYAPLGAADNHMAKGLIGQAEHSMHGDISGPYRDRVMRWQANALRYIQGNIGYVDGLLNHYWHGPKSKRQYWNRWKILVETKFNPDFDLKPDWQGLYQLVVEDPRQERQRDMFRTYFRQRDEDSTTA